MFFERLIELENYYTTVSEFKQLKSKIDKDSKIFDDYFHIINCIQTYGLTPSLAALIDPDNNFKINFEDYYSVKIATESILGSIGETIKKFFAWIWKTITSIFGRIKAFFQRLFGKSSKTTHTDMVKKEEDIKEEQIQTKRELEQRKKEDKESRNARREELDKIEEAMFNEVEELVAVDKILNMSIDEIYNVKKLFHQKKQQLEKILKSNLRFIPYNIRINDNYFDKLEKCSRLEPLFKDYFIKISDLDTYMQDYYHIMDTYKSNVKVIFNNLETIIEKTIELFKKQNIEELTKDIKKELLKEVMTSLNIHYIDDTDEYPNKIYKGMETYKELYVKDLKEYYNNDYFTKFKEYDLHDVSHNLIITIRQAVDNIKNKHAPMQTEEITLINDICMEIKRLLEHYIQYFGSRCHAIASTLTMMRKFHHAIFDVLCANSFNQLGIRRHIEDKEE